MKENKAGKGIENDREGAIVSRGVREGLCEEVTTESRPQRQAAALGGDRPQASGSPTPSFFCFQVTGLLQAWGAQVAVSKGLMFAVLVLGQERPWLDHPSLLASELPAASLLGQFHPWLYN